MFKNTIKRMKERRRLVREYIILALLRERISRLPYWREEEVLKYARGTEHTKTDEDMH